MNEIMNRRTFNTWTGREFDSQLISEKDISISDIARGLATKIRYSGQTARLVTVARHSINLSFEVKKKHALEALLHDAAEVYVGDVPAPFKCLLSEYESLERSIDRMIRRKYGLPEEVSAHVALNDIKIRQEEMKPTRRGESSWSINARQDYRDFIERFKDLYT